MSNKLKVVNFPFTKEEDYHALRYVYEICDGDVEFLFFLQLLKDYGLDHVKHAHNFTLLDRESFPLLEGKEVLTFDGWTTVLNVFKSIEPEKCYVQFSNSEYLHPFNKSGKPLHPRSPRLYAVRDLVKPVKSKSKSKSKDDDWVLAEPK